jgi:hypothetical protein
VFSALRGTSHEAPTHRAWHFHYLVLKSALSGENRAKSQPNTQWVPQNYFAAVFKKNARRKNDKMCYSFSEGQADTFAYQITR